MLISQPSVYIQLFQCLLQAPIDRYVFGNKEQMLLLWGPMSSVNQLFQNLATLSLKNRV